MSPYGSYNLNSLSPTEVEPPLLKFSKQPREYFSLFHFKENQELAVQVAGLNTIIGCLATKGFILDPKIQAMLILTGLPASWDGIQSTILANHAIDTLTAESVIPILQEEWKR